MDRIGSDRIGRDGMDLDGWDGSDKRKGGAPPLSLHVYYNDAMSISPSSRNYFKTDVAILLNFLIVFGIIPKTISLFLYGLDGCLPKCGLVEVGDFIF